MTSEKKTVGVKFIPLKCSKVKHQTKIHYKHAIESNLFNINQMRLINRTSLGISVVYIVSDDFDTD